MTTNRPLARALSLVAVLVCPAAGAFGQAAPSPTAMTRSQRNDAEIHAPLTSFPLKYATQMNDANEILTGLRLMLDPSVKLYLVTRDNTILMRGLPDDVALATQVLDQLDRPRTTYRLTFTLSQFDAGRKLSSIDYSMTLLDGQRMTLKQGARIPVQTGRYDGSGTASESQFSYVDIGLNFDATLTSNATGAILREKVEQSSLPDVQPAPSPANPASVDPTFHQIVLEGVTSLQLGRVTPLGTFDAQGPNRRTQIDVKLEKLP